MTTTNVPRSKELLEHAWGLIANSYGGDWSAAKPEWRAAAERWRDAWLAATEDGCSSSKGPSEGPPSSYPISNHDQIGWMAMRLALVALRPYTETGYRDAQPRFSGKIDGALRHAVDAGLATGAILPSQAYTMDWTPDDGAAAYEGLRVATWLLQDRPAMPEHVQTMIAGLETGLRMHQKVEILS